MGGSEASSQDAHRKRVARFPEDVQAAHARSTRHRDEIEASQTCGCFHCGETFPADEVREWIDADANGRGTTALCPRCGIDSVLGDRAGFPLTAEFLARMKAHWF